VELAKIVRLRAQEDEARAAGVQNEMVRPIRTSLKNTREKTHI